jgi:hypothetical protein
MLEELKAMNEELATLKKAHLEKSKAMFTSVASKVFAAHPKLESFGWRQYTPYFNDGEECTFSAHTSEPDINGVDGYEANFESKTVTDYDSKDASGKYQQKENPDYNPELAEAQKTVIAFLNEMDDSVLRDMFGDHVRVLVTPGGTEVDEYDHD